MFRLEDGRRYLYQWDINQRLIVETEAGTEVHFASDHDTDPNAKVVEAFEDGGVVYANIPNIMLQEAGSIKAYLFLENEDEGHTQAEYTITVRGREKPEDYVYTETEVLRYTDLKERIEKLEKGGGGIGTDEEVLQLLVDTDMLPAVYNADGKVLTDEAGRIVLRY